MTKYYQYISVWTWQMGTRDYLSSKGGTQHRLSQGVSIQREAGTSCWILQKEKKKQFYDARTMDIKLQM